MDRDALNGPFVMLLSAAIFGYFGFGTTFITTSGITGQFLLYVAILEWTLRGAAFGYALAAGFTFAQPLIGNLIYAVVGLASALGFVVVAVMDFADTKHTAMSPILLLIFAAWNGYASWSGLQAVLGVRRRAAGSEDAA